MIAATIAATMAADNFRRRRRETASTQTPTNQDLVVEVGRFLVCPTGITAVLEPSLRKLSRHYPWKWVPAGIAMLKLAVLDQGTSWQMAFAKLTEEEHEMIDNAFGVMRWVSIDGVETLEHDSDVVDSIMKLVDWAPTLAAKCPHESLAKDLSSLNEWDAQQLDDCVMRGFLS